MTVKIIKRIGTARIVKLDDGFSPITFEVRDAKGNHRGVFTSVLLALPKAERVGYQKGQYYRDVYGNVAEGTN